MSESDQFSIHPIEPFKGQEPSKPAAIKLPDFFQNYLDRWQTIAAQSKERKQVLTQNEIAHERMSNQGWRLRNLLDAPEFRAMEHEYTNRYENGSTYTGYSLSIPAAEPGFNYHINVDRNQQGDATRVGVYTYADGDRTTGRDDGRWSVSFHDAYQSTSKKGKQRIEMWDSEVEGDHYLGKETTSVIEKIGINSTSTNLHLKGVDFGGHPSAHVWFKAWGEDTKNKGSVVGPIGKIRNIHILGISRAMQVTKEHISDTSSTDYDITDDFAGDGLNLSFDRGKMDLAIKKQASPTGEETLNVAFSGIRQRLAGMGPNGERMIKEEGREYKNFSIPRGMLNGQTVLDMLDHCITNLEVAVKNKQSTNTLPTPNA